MILTDGEIQPFIFVYLNMQTSLATLMSFPGWHKNNFTNEEPKRIYDCKYLRLYQYMPTIYFVLFPTAVAWFGSNL